MKLIRQIPSEWNCDVSRYSTTLLMSNIEIIYFKENVDTCKTQ